MIAPPPPPRPAGTTNAGRSVLLHVLIIVALIAVSILSIGMLSWGVIAYYAGRRRSLPLAFVTVGYLVAEVVGIFMLGGAEPSPTTLRDEVGFALIMMVAIGGAAHGIILHLMSPGSSRLAAATAPDSARQLRRAQARDIAYHHPAIARELNIGRPDLPGTFDDGGLVDLNAAPEHILATVTGLDLWLARRIVTDRSMRGSYASVDDLVGRGVLPAPLPAGLRETLLVIR